MFKRRRSIALWIVLIGVLVLLADVLGPIRLTTTPVVFAARPLAVIGGLQVTNTLVCGLIAVVALGVLAVTTRRRLVDTPPSGSLQNVLESVLEGRPPKSGVQSRPKGMVLRVVGITLLIYVLATQLLALFPGIGSVGIWQGSGAQRVFVPLLRGATSDWNAIIALAICAVFCIGASRIQMKATSRTRGRKDASQVTPPRKRIKRLLLWGGVVLLVLADIFGPLRVREVRISLTAEELFRVGALRITNSLIAAWLAMLVLIVVAVLGRRRLVDAPKPYSLQNILETIFELLSGFMEGLVGQKARAFFPVICTLFLYILTMNWLGLLPGVGSLGFWRDVGGERVFVPLLRGATSDLSTTLALAICVVIALQVYGIRFLGFRGYGSRFVAVGKVAQYFRAKAHGEKASASLLFRGFLDMFVGVLDIFEEITKVFSFSFRLFGNVFAGEVLLLVLAFLVPYAVSVPFIMLELFTGLIQAFIFATLATAFLGKATTGETLHASSRDSTLVQLEGSSKK